MKFSLIIIVTMSAILSSGAVMAACNANIMNNKPDGIYTDNGNETVTDKQTGLMWMKCVQGLSGASCDTGTAMTMNWKQALELAQTANGSFGTFGYSDWRLPSIAELRTLVKSACYNPSINTVLFPATVGDNHWSASQYAYNNSNAWAVHFSTGGEQPLNKNISVYVRLVRGGQ